ncbi:nanos RNA binding domain protein [Dictyocaulus viviparus]|uniref:Nanos RNA binding domain protein n=1 Tax=Dictyocaulus viviparus TaxID=29172 RepID=A0A0D8XDX5_DICVI|nr:nanos RNA binding domain protein [Dictyocaulus viviparus]
MMRRSCKEVSSRLNGNNCRSTVGRHLTKNKVELQFIEKSERNRPFKSREAVTNGPISTIDQGVLSDGSPATVGICDHTENTYPTFGIGELAEEFVSNSPSCHIRMDINRNASEEISTTTPNVVREQNSDKSVPELFRSALSNSTKVNHGVLSLSGALPLINTINQDLANLSLSELATSLALPMLTRSVLNPCFGMDKPLYSQPKFINHNNSDCSTSSITRPRLLRRFQYWSRVLQKKRHKPMCRFCYERYVHMCLDTQRPIPASSDRGMWHGHNMKERGVVTCPHLWATICSHCGATKQYAHTAEYCPFRSKI